MWDLRACSILEKARKVQRLQVSFSVLHWGRAGDSSRFLSMEHLLSVRYCAIEYQVHYWVSGTVLDIWNCCCCCCCSVAKLCLTLFLWPRELQHAKLPCHSLSPGVCSHYVRWVWCHPIISFSVTSFPPSPQSFLASGSFPVSQLFPSDGQRIEVWASASALPMNIQDWFPLGLTGLMSSVSTGLSSLLQYHSSKASILWHSAFFMVQLSHSYMATRKTVALTIRTVASKVMSLPFNRLSRFVIDFLPRNKCFFFLFVCLFFNYMAAVTIHSNFGAQENEIWHLFPSYLSLSDWTGCHDLSFLNVQF